MRIGILLYCLWSLGPIALTAQCTGLDSILNNAFKQRDEQPDRTIVTCDSIIKQLIGTKDHKCRSVLANAFLIKGYAFRNKAEYEAANIQMDSALQIRKGLGDKVGEVKTLNALSSNEKERGDYKQAFQYSIKSIEKLNKLPKKDNYLTIGNTYITAANILIELDLFSLSTLERFIEEAKIAFQRAGRKSSIVMSDYTLAIGYNKRDSLDKAEHLLNNCLEYYIAEEANYELGLVQHELGLVTQARGKPKEAEKRFRKSLQFFQEIEDTSGMNLALLGLANNYLQEGSPEKALETTEGIDLAEESKTSEQAEIERIIVDAYLSIGSISKTTPHLLRLDSLYRKISDSNKAFYVDDQERLEILLQNSIKTKNTTQIIALTFTIALSILGLILIKFARRKTKRQTLNTENQQQEKRFQQKIADILIDLRKELSEERNNVNRVIHDVICPGIISIKREIEYAIATKKDEAQPQIIEATDRLYEEARALIKQAESNPSISWLQKIALIINQLNRLDKIHIIEHFNLNGADIPDKIGNELAIIANVLLDNIEKWSEATQANFDLIRTNGSIMMIVDDNGKGFNPKNREKKTNPESTGIGLKNVRYRVEKRLGGQLEIQSQPGRSGTTITVSIPLK